MVNDIENIVGSQTNTSNMFLYHAIDIELIDKTVEIFDQSKSKQVDFQATDYSPSVQDCLEFFMER